MSLFFLFFFQKIHENTTPPCGTSKHVVLISAPTPLLPLLYSTMERPHGFPEASVVSPQLYLGGIFDAYDSELVARLSVTHVLLLTNLPGAWDAGKNRYVQARLPLPA